LAEEAVKQELNEIKKAIIRTLQLSDYQIIKSTNNPVCAIGLRENEWRCIVGHVRRIPHKIVKEFEELPCPDHKVIKKELWLRDKWEKRFYKIFWDPKKQIWIDQFGEVINFKP
jgi:hypothetical protein